MGGCRLPDVHMWDRNRNTNIGICVVFIVKLYFNSVLAQLEKHQKNTEDTGSTHLQSTFIEGYKSVVLLELVVVVVVGWKPLKQTKQKESTLHVNMNYCAINTFDSLFIVLNKEKLLQLILQWRFRMYQIIHSNHIK